VRQKTDTHQPGAIQLVCEHHVVHIRRSDDFEMACRFRDRPNRGLEQADRKGYRAAR